MNKSIEALARHQQRFEENLALQLKNHSLPGESDLNQRLAVSYQALRQRLAALESPGPAASKHEPYDREIAPALLELTGLLDKILAVNQEAILATRQNVQKITREVTRLMVIGMVIALIISAYACYQISRSVLQPILSVTKATHELSEENLTQPVPVLSRDELGELARAFNKMAAQLQEYRQSTTEEIVRLHRTMETTLASFPDPIFVLNNEGRIELMNPAAAEMAASLQMNGQLPSRLRAIAQKTLASGENFLPHSFDAVLSYRFNPAERSFLPRVLTMRNKEDALFGVAVVLYDVTRFRLLDAAKTLVTRYAQRRLIENALSDAVRFFHMNALSSAVGLKVDFDMALLVLASGLYRLVAERMRGYGDAQARQIFRDLIDRPADVEIGEKEVSVSFHRGAHLPIILASSLIQKPVAVPWWKGLPLRLTTCNGPKP